jgi:hypothetical protein
MSCWLDDNYDKHLDSEVVLAPSRRTMVVVVDMKDARDARDLTDTALPVGDWCDVRLPEKERNLLLVVVSF